MLPTFPDLPAEPVPVPASTPSISSTSRFNPESASRPALPASRFTLPDGTPLNLTMSRKVVYVSLVGNFGVQTAEDALVLLYLSSPHFNPRERWAAPLPLEDGAAESPLQETDPDFYTALRLRIEAWADTIPHTQLEELYVLACGLWNDQHVTFPMVVPGSETPDSASGQKKSPDSPRTGPPPTPASSPEAT